MSVTESPEVSPTIRGVVFDLDGTLYDKRPLERAFLWSMPWSIPRLYRYTKVRKSLAGQDFGTAEAIFAETRRRLATGSRAQARWQRWIDEVYDPGLVRNFARAVRPYPGVSELLSQLRAGGIRLGLVSDYRGIETRLQLLGLGVCDFDFCMVTEIEGAMKPAPRMAERTLAGMGLQGSEMLMVGDREFADAAFARAAAMEFVGVVAPGGQALDKRWMPWGGVCRYVHKRCL